MSSNAGTPNQPLTYMLIACILLASGWVVNESARYGMTASVPAWVQPEIVTIYEPGAISANEWAFDYQPIAQALQSIGQDDSGQWVLGANALESLQQAVNHLPVAADARVLQRVAFLVTQSGPAPSSGHLADILVRYYHYQNQLRISLTNIAGDDLHLAQARLKATQQWQLHFFSEDIAQALFGQTNLLNDYLITRRLFQQSTDLTPEEKNQNLSQLQQQFNRRRLQSQHQQPLALGK